MTMSNMLNVRVMEELMSKRGKQKIDVMPSSQCFQLLAPFFWYHAARSKTKQCITAALTHTHTHTYTLVLPGCKLTG